MRGMIKWQPFSTMLTKKDIILIEKNRLKITKPILAEDKINELDWIIKNSYKNNTPIKIKYFKINSLETITGTIKKVDKIEKYILINDARIYFKNIINITEI